MHKNENELKKAQPGELRSHGAVIPALDRRTGLGYTADYILYLCKDQTSDDEMPATKKVQALGTNKLPPFF